jgi:hypothetical protein
MGNKKKEVEPKNAHGVNFNLNVNSEDADLVREALISAGHIKLAETFETKREISIMHEVLSSKGSNFDEKVANCIETWAKGCYGAYETDTRVQKYNMKHRVLYATNG